jgi:hypothetical protein
MRTVHLVMLERGSHWLSEDTGFIHNLIVLQSSMTFDVGN